MSTTTSRRTAAAVGMLLLVYMIGLVLVGPVPAGATHVDPQWVEGNQNCAAATGTSELLRLETAGQLAVGSATYQVDGGTISVTINQGATFDWSSTVLIAAVFVKGGPDGNLYDYRPLSGATADQGLHAPDNTGSGGFYGLSHITFCRFDSPPTTVPPTTVPETTVPETTAQSTTTGGVGGTVIESSTTSSQPAATSTSQVAATVLGTVIESSTTIAAVSASTLPFTGFELESTVLLAVAALMTGLGLLLVAYGTEKPAKVSRIPGKW